MAQTLNSEGEFEKSALLLQPLYHEFEGSKFVEEHLVRAHTLLEELPIGGTPLFNNSPWTGLDLM